MSSWDFTNIGASGSSQDIKYLKKIFEYMGYCPNYEIVPCYDEFRFGRLPHVYCCMSSIDSYYDDQISFVFELNPYGVKELRNLLNALFPGILFYIHSASGDDVSDTWESHDEVFNPDDMTCYGVDSYTDYGGGTYRPARYWKARFILEPPPLAYVEALTQISKDDGNEELTELLTELARKLRNDELVYIDDGSDTRKVNKKYDIVKGKIESLGIPSAFGSHQTLFGRNYFGTKRQIRMNYASRMAEYKEYKENLAQVLASVSLDEYLHKPMENVRAGTPDLINPDADVVIDGKRFYLDESFPFYYEMREEIRIRGGLFNPSGVVKKTDFFVIDLELRDAYHSESKLKFAQQIQSEGLGLRFITEYQLWKALFDARNPVLSDDVLKDRSALSEAPKGSREDEKERQKKEREAAIERCKAAWKKARQG